MANTIKTFDEAYAAICSETVEMFGGMSLMDTDVLIAAAKGEVDLNIVARAFVASRGMVANGSGNTATWAGFDNAKKFWKNY